MFEDRKVSLEPSLRRSSLVLDLPKKRRETNSNCSVRSDVPKNKLVFSMTPAVVLRIFNSMRETGRGDRGSTWIAEYRCNKDTTDWGKFAAKSSWRLSSECSLISLGIIDMKQSPIPTMIHTKVCARSKKLING